MTQSYRKRQWLKALLLHSSDCGKPDMAQLLLWRLQHPSAVPAHWSVMCAVDPMLCAAQELRVVGAARKGTVSCKHNFSEHWPSCASVFL